MELNAKTKKILIIAGIVIFVLIVVTAVLMLINNRDGNNGNTTTENVELVYWGLWEPDSVMQPLIDEYENINPGVNILYSQQSFTNYESRLYTRLEQSSSSTEPAPDIFRIHNTWTPKYYRYLVSLPSTVMTASEYATTFYPTAVNDFTAKNGYIYAMPLEIDGLVVFYNKELLSDAGLEEPPSDWDSFVQAARELTVKTDAGKITTAGLALGSAENINHSAEILSFLLLQEGVDIIDRTYTTVNLTTTKAEGVLDTYTGFALGDDSTWFADLDDDLSMFYSGKLAMMIAPSWRAFDIITAAPTIEFGTSALPQLEANDEEIYYSTYWGEAVSSTCENPDVAWDFINFLAQKEQQLEMYSNSSQVRAFGEPYSLVELNSEMVGDTYVSAIAEMASKMQSWQMGDESFVKATLNEAITSVLQDEKDSDTALADAEELINEQLAESNQ